MVQRSTYVIKPEGMPDRVLIRKQILGAGLKIIWFEDGYLTQKQLAELYPDIAAPHGILWFALSGHLLGLRCEFGVVEGANAIQKLLKICGRDINPNQCPKNSIRGMYGFKMPLELQDPQGAQYWFNAIHRAQNREEAERDLKVFRQIAPPGRL